MATMSKIAPCLWFDTEAEQAAKHYVSIFKDSAIENVSYYGKEGFEVHGRPAGSVMVVSFRLAGQLMTALNGGPQFKFSEAISLQVFCEDQPEIDHYWERLSEGGSPSMCGWLKDKYGLSWQVVPAQIAKLMTDADPKKSGRVMQAVMQMQKLDLAAMQRAFDGR